MTWYPIAFLPPQYQVPAGAAFSGAVLKAYRAESSTVIPMATDYTGATLATSFALNSAGYPVSGGAVIIPHVQEDYKLALYPTQAAADANSGDVWTVDNIKIAVEETTAFVQTFSGDGINSSFTLSQDLGTDEKTVMIFADRASSELAANGNFNTDTVWSKGTGWTISGGQAVALTATSNLAQTPMLFPIITGELYILKFSSTVSAGNFTPSVGGVNGTVVTTNGNQTQFIVAGSTEALIFAGSGFSGNIDNVSLKRIGTREREIYRPDEFTLNGTSLVFNSDVIPAEGTNNILVFAPSLLFGAVANAANAAAASEANAAASAASAASSASTASTAATNAAASALAAANSAAQFQGTSTTSVTIGTGVKAFTTQSGKLFNGENVRVFSAADPSNFMDGIANYSGTSLSVAVLSTGGAGTFTDWIIKINGAPGVAGAAGAPGSAGPAGPAGTGVFWGGTSAGTNSITATPSPSLGAYAAGQTVIFKIGGTNTGGATVNFNGLGAINTRKMIGSGLVSLTTGDLQAGALAEMVYDGTVWILLNPNPYARGVAVASASGVTFNGAIGDYFDVTGTTTINTITLSEGRESSVKFTGAMTLTNGASLVLPGGANILTASGDTAIFRGEASSVVKCVNYQRANGRPLIDSMADQLLHVQDQKTSGTDGGTFSNAAWRTRVLNTVVTNQVSGASLATNQITLTAGSYYLYASAPATDVDQHQTRWFNITDTATTIVGTSECVTNGLVTQTRSFVSGRFTISATKVFELQHQCTISQTTDGLGRHCGFDVVEVYADVKIWRLV